MRFRTINLLLSLATTVMAIAVISPGEVTSPTVTFTVTEPVCMNSLVAEPTPLSIARALAAAADASAAASLIANMTADGHAGDATSQIHSNATTVTTVTSATDCPASPTFDLTPALVSSLFNGDLNNTTVNNTGGSGTEDPAQHWAKNHRSLCFTTSSWVGNGYYAIYLDGWGRETDGCGKGALDNLHAQCFDVQYWECRYWGSSGVLLTFYLSAPPNSKCALTAMWVASPKDDREEGLCCVYLGFHVGAMNTC
ncbi:hypothetical protein Daus18300_011751 [Diaporthe australafricana]|uniref:Uncharacterized protein n=1 Tax=Diaporthe australafricana TaxID=127596 RepID=A0ABR3W5R7_9PEZI